MPSFTTFDGIAIAYTEYGPVGGAVVLLQHGYADAAANWLETELIDALARAGRRVINVDARGHGASDKPHDSTAYQRHAMTRDLQALLDHLLVDAADAVGYSMGSLVVASLASAEKRVRSVVLGGIGVRALEGDPARWAAIADAFEVDDASSIRDDGDRGFRSFVDSTGADRLALAALARAFPENARSTLLAEIHVPTLVLAGDNDDRVGAPEPVAVTIPNARLRLVSGDHGTAVVDPAFTQAIIDFLAEVSPVPAPAG